MGHQFHPFTAMIFAYLNEFRSDTKNGFWPQPIIPPFTEMICPVM